MAQDISDEAIIKAMTLLDEQPIPLRDRYVWDGESGHMMYIDTLGIHHMVDE